MSSEAKHWRDLEAAAPELARIGRRLLLGSGSGEVALLATIDAQQLPRLAPICPILSAGALYLLAGSATPKRRHLDANGAYALHAQVGADDLEFQLRGTALPVVSATERAAVIEAVPFPSFDPTDPIFELRISQAYSVSWKDGKRLLLRWPD